MSDAKRAKFFEDNVPVLDTVDDGIIPPEFSPRNIENDVQEAMKPVELVRSDDSTVFTTTKQEQWLEDSEEEQPLSEMVKNTWSNPNDPWVWNQEPIVEHPPETTPEEPVIRDDITTEWVAESADIKQTEPAEKQTTPESDQEEEEEEEEEQSEEEQKSEFSSLTVGPSNGVCILTPTKIEEPVEDDRLDKLHSILEGIQLKVDHLYKVSRGLGKTTPKTVNTRSRFCEWFGQLSALTVTFVAGAIYAQSLSDY